MCSMVVLSKCDRWYRLIVLKHVAANEGSTLYCATDTTVRTTSCRVAIESRISTVTTRARHVPGSSSLTRSRLLAHKLVSGPGETQTLRSRRPTSSSLLHSVRHCRPKYNNLSAESNQNVESKGESVESRNRKTWSPKY